MATLKVAVVSAERELWSGEAKSVVAKTPEGEIGILPGHEPVLAVLVEGPVRIEETDGRKLLVAVHGGRARTDQACEFRQRPAAQPRLRSCRSLQQVPRLQAAWPAGRAGRSQPAARQQ